MLNSQIVGFTHNDLDALGVILCVQNKISINRWFNTNYSDIDLRAEECLKYCKENNIHKIIIGDVSFSDHKDILDNFYNYITNFEDGYILHCDHHSYPDCSTFWNCYPKMKVVYNDEKSATIQLMKLFKIDNENLIKLCNIINSFDCWKKDSKYFNASQMLNDYFWDFVRVQSDGTTFNQYNRISILAQLLSEIDYKLPGDFKSITERYLIKAENDYNTFKQHNILKRYNANVNTTVILSNESFNRIQLKEMADGQDFIVGVYHGIFMCRVNEKSNFSLEFLRELRYQLCDKPDFCHPYAFTYPLDNKGSGDDIINEIKRILTVINTIPKDIKKCTCDDLPF